MALKQQLHIWASVTDPIDRDMLSALLINFVYQVQYVEMAR